MPDARKPIIKTFTLDTAQLALVTDLARSNPFFTSILAGYCKYGTVTGRQYRAIHNEMCDVFVVEGVTVMNRLRRDNRVVCFRCPQFATRAVGKVGVCAEHVNAQRDANLEFEKKQRQRSEM